MKLRLRLDIKCKQVPSLGVTYLVVELAKALKYCLKFFLIVEGKTHILMLYLLALV